MLVQEVMTADVKCCTMEDSAQTAAQMMKTVDTGVIPVIENSDQPTVVGIVTDRDLCLNVVAEAKNPANVKLREIVSDRVIGCYAEDEVEGVANAMAVYQVRRLPVFDEDGRLLGIVSLGDLSRERAIESEDSGEVLASVSEPAEDDKIPPPEKGRRSS